MISAIPRKSNSLPLDIVTQKGKWWKKELTARIICISVRVHLLQTDTFTCTSSLRVRLSPGVIPHSPVTAPRFPPIGEQFQREDLRAPCHLPRARGAHSAAQLLLLSSRFICRARHSLSCRRLANYLTKVCVCVCVHGRGSDFSSYRDSASEYFEKCVDSSAMKWQRRSLPGIWSWVTTMALSFFPVFE